MGYLRNNSMFAFGKADRTKTRSNVQGISVGSTQMFEMLCGAIAANGIKPVIDKVFGFDEARAAYHHMASGAHFGKIVIRVTA